MIYTVWIQSSFGAFFSISRSEKKSLQSLNILFYTCSTGSCYSTQTVASSSGNNAIWWEKFIFSWQLYNSFPIVQKSLFYFHVCIRFLGDSHLSALQVAHRSRIHIDQWSFYESVFKKFLEILSERPRLLPDPPFLLARLNSSRRLSPLFVQGRTFKRD